MVIYYMQTQKPRFNDNTPLHGWFLKKEDVAIFCFSKVFETRLEEAQQVISAVRYVCGLLWLREREREKNLKKGG